MAARLALLATGCVLAAVWLLLRLRYLRGRGKPFWPSGVPLWRLVLGVLFFGGGVVYMLYVGFAKPLNLASAGALLIAPFLVICVGVVAVTWYQVEVRKAR